MPTTQYDVLPGPRIIMTVNCLMMGHGGGGRYAVTIFLVPLVLVSD